MLVESSRRNSGSAAEAGVQVGFLQWRQMVTTSVSGQSGAVATTIGWRWWRASLMSWDRRQVCVIISIDIAMVRTQATRYTHIHHTQMH